MIGTGRCGSTLLHEILCRHEGVTFFTNVGDRIGRRALGSPFAARAFRRMPPELAKKGRLRYAPSEGYRALARAVSPLLSDSDRDLAASDVTPWLARRMRDFVGNDAVSSLDVFLHKFTGWPRAGFLQEVFPSARFVHVVRDGRAVANSWLQMPWWDGYRGPSSWHFGPLSDDYQSLWAEHARSYPVLAGIGWMILIDAWIDAREQLAPGSWVDVRYEDLVANPEDVTKSVVEFLGLPWTPAFAAQLSRYSFDESRLDAHTRDLGSQHVATLTSVMQRHLELFGYDSDL